MGISACLLTKNEGGKIEKCLENIKDYVDEIVIVDGLSKDNTIEIAKRYTDRIFQKEFSGSFAVERNYSIEKSKEDWVFIVAPDELPTESLLIKLRELINENKYDAYSFIRNDVKPDGEVLDMPCGHPEINVLLAKRDKMRFYGAIHERAVVFGRIKFIPEVVYHHRGYMVNYPPEKEERFRKIAETAKERDQGLDLSRWFLIRRGLRLIIHYYFNMLIGMGLYKKGLSGLLLSIKYTKSFVFFGVSQYKKQGQI